MNKKLLGLCVCRDGLIGISVLLKLEFCSFRGYLLYLGLVLASNFFLAHSVSELIPHDNKYKPLRSYYNLFRTLASTNPRAKSGIR